MRTLAAVAPADTVIVDESATSLPHVLRHLPLATPNAFFGSKTGTLGWAMGAALGVQIASPGRPVRDSRLYCRRSFPVPSHPGAWEWWVRSPAVPWPCRGCSR